ncbi:tRNA(His) guanylyltransferase Thg1 family protein [Schlesneria sp. T3-172]|uniref:tRNA(His) guanylyltransferase Thg1 family protein n=1 Tax=Schlesneria sphaerica TaxID=3373610 RepID=UPI0037CA0BCC
MKFDDLDRKMRVYETVADYCVLPGVHMVARLDGRSFTRLTKEICKFEAPFDLRFRDLMVTTAEGLMTCGFRVIYAYTQSDEISLLFDLDERQFGRKLRKFNSTLAGEASARFSLLLGNVATFDCRISQLPNIGLVVDYFRWRNEDAARNAMSAHCYWMSRKQGLDQRAATAKSYGLSVGQMNEFLFQQGINFNDLPNWQKRGVGLSWESVELVTTNRKTGDEVAVRRQRIKRNFDLPMKDEYSRYIEALITKPANDERAEKINLS